LGVILTLLTKLQVTTIILAKIIVANQKKEEK